VSAPAATPLAVVQGTQKRGSCIVNPGCDGWRALWRPDARVRIPAKMRGAEEPRRAYRRGSR